MNDKKEETKKYKFTVTGTKKDIILDYKGIAITGFIIHYITERGSTGFIETPEKEYTKEKALKLIETDVKKLEEIL
ncbi:hypothetical protein ES708_33822 [subsurface metagenome]